MSKIINSLLDKLSFHVNNESAHNIRENGEMISRNSTENIIIETKSDKPGIDIKISCNTKGEEVYIPVVVSAEGINDLVYNDFYIEDNAEVTIYAGCIVHNDCDIDSMHEGIHTFHIGKNAKVKYIEKHYGCGINKKKVINTKTIININEYSTFEIETIQIEGVDKSFRETYATLNDNSSLIINEKLLTSSNDEIKTVYEIDLDGVNSKTNLSSRSVAKENSKQEFISNINGNNKCFGHVECDAILMDNSVVSSTPKIIAKTNEAILTHEAAIGKIAQEQILKLMTLGLSEKEAEEAIIKGFLN